MLKQVIILRKDLKMRKGKMVAQGAHASMLALVQNANLKEPGPLVLPVNDDCLNWLKGDFTKVVVSVETESALRGMHMAAKLQNIPAALVVDKGYTEFNGVPTPTAVAIGPADSDHLDRITGHLPLL